MPLKQYARAVHNPQLVRLSKKRSRTSPPRLRRGLFLLLVPVSLALTELASRNPELVEAYYSRGFYRRISSTFGRASGLAPFSVAELALYALSAGVTGWLIYHIAALFRLRDFRSRLPGMLATVCCAAGISYFLFTALCGLNYHRLTFSQQSGLIVRPSSARELADLYAELIADANEARAKVRVDSDGAMLLSEDNIFETAKKAPLAIELVSRRYPIPEGYTPRAKPVISSRAMSAMDITGIYIPFTFEGNVNVDVPDYSIPFSMVHELAHFKGYMREDEANFISYLGCREMDDPAFVYSGTALALIHCGNALYSSAPELYAELFPLLSEDVRHDFAQAALYWEQFEGPIQQAAGKINDSYLKSNRQEDGIRSYGGIVDLLLADYRARHGLD